MFDKIIRLLQFIADYLQDMFLVIRYNTYSPLEDVNRRLYYRIVILTHAIEKGLSLPRPRLLFGRDKLEYIMKMVEQYDATFSPFPLEMAYGAMKSYVAIHRELGVDDDLVNRINKFIVTCPKFAGLTPHGGIREIQMSAPVVSAEQLSAFIKSRSSCRFYKPMIVDRETLHKVITLANSAPSQCNRQSVRVHCYQDKSKISELLALQGGAAGFADDVFNLFVVTSEATAWGNSGQRNQAYVDGGLFSMDLLLACHAYGIACCPLNMAVTNRVERRIKAVGGIHLRERPVMLIAFGYPHGEVQKGAYSFRIRSDRIITFH
jgi:nitroreductase